MLVGNQGSGTLEIDNGGQLKLTGPDSSIDVAATAGSFGTINVDGAGSNLTNAGTFFTLGDRGTGILTITGGGQVNDVVADVGFNNGSAGTVTVDGVGSLWNTTGTVVLGGGASTQGTPGMLEVVNGGAAVITGTLAVTSQGTVLGNGTVTAGSIANNGVFSPGVAPSAPLGALHVTSDITQNTSSHLQIQMGGTTAATQYDQLLVTGAVHLGGALDVSLVGGFTPASGDSFDVITWTTHTSTFDTVNLPTLPGLLVWDTAQLYSAGILSVILPGDYNHNGVVDAADYTIWRDSLDQTGGGLAADGNDDGVVNQTDLQFWMDRFGHHPPGAGSASSAAVPEPSTFFFPFPPSSRLRPAPAPPHPCPPPPHPPPPPPPPPPPFNQPDLPPPPLPPLNSGGGFYFPPRFFCLGRNPGAGPQAPPPPGGAAIWSLAPLKMGGIVVVFFQRLFGGFVGAPPKPCRPRITHSRGIRG